MPASPRTGPSSAATSERSTYPPCRPAEIRARISRTWLTQLPHAVHAERGALGIQHQMGNAMVGEVRYVSSKTTDDFQSIDANPFLLPVVSAFPGFYPSSLSLCTDPTARDGYGRPNCNASNLIETVNGGCGRVPRARTEPYHAELSRPDRDSVLHFSSKTSPTLPMDSRKHGRRRQHERVRARSA